MEGRLLHDARLDLICCPVCRGALHSRGETLECGNGHSYPVVAGVPRLLTSEGRADARAIGSTFGKQWSLYRHGRDRTWGRTAQERVQEFLTDIDRPAGWLLGKRVLDAGCGNGVLSHAVADLGASVLATDVSPSVEEAYRRFGSGVVYVQSDLGRPAFRAGAFDVVYSGGVLHHTPDTRTALAAVADAVRPGGILFVWLYSKRPGAAYLLRSLLRRAVRPLPPPIRTAAVTAIAALGWLLRRRGRTWPEILVVEVDFFTPRYRWEHTPAEARTWLHELGFERIETFPGRDGFGIRARRPRLPTAAPAR